jgi:hypothetical protein
MLRRRQGMYNQGFAEISSKYSSLAKNLTNPYNAQVRNQFLAQAQNELKNLSAMDLSQQQNVQSASNVFTPLYGNRNLMSDLSVTSHWDQQEKIAESFRLKDGGKEYSDDNIEFVRMQRNAFAQDRPESVGSYLQAKRYFSPYYDYAKEYKEAMAAYKPNKVKFTRPDNRGYLVTEEDESYDAEDVKLYLSNVLSTKAKGQMSIEGVVKYANNPDIINGYTKGLGKTEKFLQTRLEEIEGKMMVEKDVEKKKEYESGVSMLRDKLEEVSGEKAKMDNPEYVNRNREAIASSLYYSNKIEELSKGYARKNKTYEMKPDDVYLTRLRESGLNQRHKDTLADNAKNRADNELTRANERLLKQADLGLVTFDTRGNIVRVQDQPFTVPTGESQTGMGYKEFQQQKTSVIQAQVNATENLKKYFYAINPVFEQQGLKMTDKKVQSAFDQFIIDQTNLMKTNPKSNQLSPRFMQFKSSIEAGALQLATFDEKEKKANALYQEDIKSSVQEINKIFGGKAQEVEFYDPKTKSTVVKKITADDFVKIYMNTKDYKNRYSEKNTGNFITDDRTLDIVVDGKVASVRGMFSQGALEKAFSYLKKNNQTVQSAKSRFNSIYDQEYTKNEVMLRPINEKDPIVVAAKNNMQNATLVSADNIVISGYNKGKYMFGFKAGIDKTKLPSEEELAAMGVQRAPGYTDENPKFIVQSSLFSPRTGESTYSSKEQVITNYFEGMGNATETNREVVYASPPGLLTVGQGLNPIQIVKTSRYGQPDTYDIKDELTGIMLNNSVPLNLDQVIETMRKIEADPMFLPNVRNFKSK